MQFIQKIFSLNEPLKESNLSFDDLYKLYYVDIRNYISKLCGCWTIAEEITQEVFIKLYNNLNKISHNNILGWLYKVAHNLTINYFNQNPKLNFELYDNLYNEANDTYDLIEKNNEKRIISEVFLKLPQKQAQAILLKDLYGYSYKEISNILKLSNKAVKSLLYRGRQNFIKYYNEVINNEL